MVLAAALGAAVIEGGAALTTRVLVARGWMAEVPRFTAKQVEDYFAQRDALGWTSSFEPPQSPCVSAYGDSFTAGSDGTSYPSELAALLGCPVANYGVGGYGSDQAFMLASSLQGVDVAPVAVLGHVSENILRNLNQYRNLLYPGQELFFKPRFVLNGDSLRTLASPIQVRGDFLRLERSPEAVLTYDEFMARPRRAFPYAFSIVRWLFNDFHWRAALARVPRHEPFYREAHPAAGLQLTTKILTAFALEVRRDERREVIVLIPTGGDLVYAKKTGRWPDQPLADRLQALNIAVVHAGPLLLSRLGEEDPCALFGACNAHFNARGLKMLAELIAPSIKSARPLPARVPGSQ